MTSSKFKVHAPIMVSSTLNFELSTMAKRLTNLISASALPFCLAAMDGCAIYALAWIIHLVVLSDLGMAPVAAPPLLTGLELAAWGVSTYLLNRTKWSLAIIRWLVGPLGVLICVGLTLVLGPENQSANIQQWFIVFSYTVIIMIALWAIGAYRASGHAGFDEAYSAFRLGLVVVALAAVVGSLATGKGIPSVWEGMGGVAFWFVAWSLAALALGNRDELRLELGTSEVRFWTPLLAVSLAGIVLIAILSGLFALGDLLAILQQAVGGVILLFGAVLYISLYAIFWLITQLPRLPIKINRSETPTPTPQPMRSPLNEWLQQLRELESDPAQSMSPDVQRVLMIVVAIVLMAFVAWLVSRSLRRTHQDVGRDAIEEREALGSWPLLFAQMRSWLDTLLARFRRTEPGVAPTSLDELSQLRGKEEWSGTLSVRQIYAHLQSLASQSGYPRAPQQTPSEYLTVLSSAFPDFRSDLASITSAYIEARYSPFPISGHTVLVANNAWKRTEPAIKEQSVKRRG